VPLKTVRQKRDLNIIDRHSTLKHFNYFNLLKLTESTQKHLIPSRYYDLLTRQNFDAMFKEELSIVQAVKCDRRLPACLYDFTHKIRLIEFL
jgi:hypothetical protein